MHAFDVAMCESVLPLQLERAVDGGEGVAAADVVLEGQAFRLSTPESPQKSPHGAE
jgi:hypothetical protein